MKSAIFVLAFLLLPLPQLAAQEPDTADDSAVDAPAVEPLADEPSTDEPTTDEPSMDEPSSMEDEPAGEEVVEEVVEEDPDSPVETVNSPSLIDQVREEARRRAALITPPLTRYPAIDWHGSFRFRADLFGEADLGTYAATSETEYTATSLFLPPLKRNYINDPGSATFEDKLSKESEKTLGSANLRLRLSPVFRLSDTIRIGTTVDLLDNLVLGSTPEYLGNVSSSGGNGGFYKGYPGPSVPLDTFTNTQVPPSAGINALNDSVSVKEAYAEWHIAFDDPLRPDSFNLGTLKVGRYAYDWGLGILTSRGDYDRNDTALTTIERFRALDAEWGNYLDRFSWRYDFSLFNVMVGYGWLGSGAVSYGMQNAYGQSYDIEQQDDIHQVELAIFSRPETRDDFISRRKGLFSGNAQIDWGLYVTWRSQESATTLKDGTSPSAVDLADDYAGLQLVDRAAWLLTPDLWLRMDWRPDPKTRYYAALEAAAVVGSLDSVDDKGASTTVDVLQYGGALETNFTLGMISFGLDAGMASGDDGELMAWYTGREKNPWGSDNRYSAFSFNRNYAIDLLLYRQVLGTVSNSAYFRPHFDFVIIPTEDGAFGGLISGLYAMALLPEAYPGDSANLGLELDAHLFYEETNRFLVSGGFGFLYPFAALDRPKDFLIENTPGNGAEWAWTLQGNIFLVF